MGTLGSIFDRGFRNHDGDPTPNPMVHSQLPQQMPHGDDAFINENKPKKGPKKVKQPKKLQMPVSMAFPDLLENEEAVEKKDAALPSSQAPLDAQCSSEADKALVARDR